ncbi:chorismate mutase [Streptomyces alkaliphilus]|uniref:Chorismate mutase n=2 Tax=Streptomyces alkaliphilus TaxID=1472722 RepID=A0A7W3TH46_9ACTN|nr:chorismate mutase [Streptomyces alkaliphilus]MBB0246662.1 chorismate mutase [Streptomyces alkaliphilus]
MTTTTGTTGTTSTTGATSAGTVTRPVPDEDTGSAAGPAAEGSATDRTGARTPAAAGEIGDARRVIDDLDERIIGLIRERMGISERIQRARIASGGRRVHLAREMEVLRHYGDALGRPGTDLAMIMLELGRGRI